MYNLLIKTHHYFNMLRVTDKQLFDKVIPAYLDGLETVTISGRSYNLNGINQIRIFDVKNPETIEQALHHYANNIHFRSRNLDGTWYINTKALSEMGSDVTQKLIGDSAYGELKHKPSDQNIRSAYVDSKRLSELRNINNNRFDLTRLIRLCEELEDNHSRSNYLSVAIICRAILDHVPPIFGYDTFENVVANYGGPKVNKSFKRNVQNLQASLRNISDNFLHQKIRDKEVLPTQTQVDFRNDMDVLLGEVVRILK